MELSAPIKRIYALEFFLRGFYFSVKTILIYLMVDRGICDFTQAGAFLALFASLYFLSPLVGSVLTDKYLGLQGAMGLGVILNLCAGLLLQQTSNGGFFLSLACLLASGGLTKGNVVCLVTQGTQKHMDSLIFVLLYATTNVAAFVLPNTLGFVGETYGWLFATALGCFLCIPPLFLLRFDVSRLLSAAHGLILTAGYILILYACFYFWDHIRSFTPLYGFVLVLGIFGVALSIRATFTTLTIILFAGLYTGFAEMIFFDLNKDIFTNMNRWIGSFQVPAAWFMTARALFIFLIGLGMAHWQKKPRTSSKRTLFVRFSSSFFLLGTSFLVHQTGLYLNAWWPLFSIALMACGFFLNAMAEILVIPDAIGYVSNGASPPTRARTMGLFYAFLALGVFCAPFISNALVHSKTGIFLFPNTTPYVHITLALFFLSLVSYMISKSQKKVTK